jgi:isoleucyl-tRNA synthetase
MHLKELFIVSQIELLNGNAGDAPGGISVEVFKAEGKKCERCWNYSIHVGEDKNYPTVCERCSAALSVIEKEIAEAAS